MKNILAENMLRFGAKNLTESQKRALRILTEEVLAGVTDGCAVVGATKSNTTNAAAVAAFIKAGYTVTGTISETTCITKPAGGSSSGYAVGPKTVQAKHYLKIGEKVISGTAPSSMIISFSDLKGQSIEAAGNGIFALGRALKAKSSAKGFGLTMTAGLSITLNTTKVILSMFNIKTGYQNAANNFGSDALRAMIGLATLEPTQTTPNICVTGLSARAKGTAYVSQVFGKTARPMIADITDAEKEQIYPVGPIDVTGYADKGRKINNEAGAIPYVRNFCKLYFKSWIDSCAAKFKKYIEIRATAAGVPVDALETLNALIDAFSKTQNVETYTQEALDKLFILYKPTQSKSGGVVGMSSTSTSIAGKEGSITGASGQK